jgi:hypothetical protein
LLACSVVLCAVGCEIAANIDRTRIPGEGGAASGPGGGGSGGAGPCEPSSCPGSDSDCRKRACDEEGCTFADEPSGTACGDATNPDAKLCDGSGNCVACLSEDDCPTQEPVCLDNVCHAATCGDRLKNGPETDVDCGGGCPGCDNGKVCAAATDCVSGFCEGAGGGSGACAPCVNPSDCTAPLMCMNGVCQ